jgi:NADPH:quinone reductase-like Zn-dependent oxidoreductase
VKAARLTVFGETPGFEVQELPDLKPGPGEAVVQLRAAALNRRDPWVYKTPDYCRLPVTLGSDGAGVVASVGPGVKGVSVGDEVVIYPALGWKRGRDVPGPEFDILGAPTDGTFAEQVRVDAGALASRPQRLDWVQSAAVNLGGLTAWRAVVRGAQAGPGRSLLITGAGGGVSTFAIQIAAALGAEVYVTSSSAEKIERAVALGARGGVEYSAPDWSDQVRALLGRGFDAAVDSYGGPSWPGALRALREGGVLVSFGDTSPAPANIEVSDVYWAWRSIVGTTMGSPEEYEALLEHLAGATWEPVIDSVFALEEIDAACRRLDRAPDRFGKVALSIG